MQEPALNSSCTISPYKLDTWLAGFRCQYYQNNFQTDFPLGHRFWGNSKIANIKNAMFAILLLFNINVTKLRIAQFLYFSILLLLLHPQCTHLRQLSGLSSVKMGEGPAVLHLKVPLEILFLIDLGLLMG